MGAHNSNLPLVSIVTPGWNGKSFVHRLLDSILAQTYDNMEYIYVDDGSTDGTKDVVLDYKSRFERRGIAFKYVYKENGGLCSAIQEGLQHVNGKYLCWPEYDDILLPSAIEKRIDYLEKHPDCAVVTCDAWITPDDDLEHPTDVLSYHNPNRFDRNHFFQLLTGNSIFTSACHLVRMDAFDETHPGRNIFQSRYGAIWQMLLPVLYNHNRGFIDEPLVKWVVRKSSVSNEKYSLAKRIKVDEEFLAIRKAVINGIDMPSEDKDFYIRISEICTAMSFMEHGLEYKNKQLFYRGYDYLTGHNVSITKDIRIGKFRVDHTLFDYAYLFCLKMHQGYLKLLKSLYHSIFS